VSTTPTVIGQPVARAVTVTDLTCGFNNSNDDTFLLDSLTVIHSTPRVRRSAGARVHTGQFPSFPRGAYLAGPRPACRHRPPPRSGQRRRAGRSPPAAALFPVAPPGVGGPRTIRSPWPTTVIQHVLRCCCCCCPPAPGRGIKLEKRSGVFHSTKRN